jgi:hypothetical protein
VKPFRGKRERPERSKGGDSIPSARRRCPSLADVLRPPSASQGARRVWSRRHRRRGCPVAARCTSSPRVGRRGPLATRLKARGIFDRAGGFAFAGCPSRTPGTWPAADGRSNGHEQTRSLTSVRPGGQAFRSRRAVASATSPLPVSCWPPEPSDGGRSRQRR